MLTLAPSLKVDPTVTVQTRLTGFAGFLRANGYSVGAGDSVRVLQTASHVGMFDENVLRWSLRALLCSRGDEWRRFDPLFDAYFLPPNKSSFASNRDVAAAGRSAASSTADQRPRDAGYRSELAASDDDSLTPRHGASRGETLESTDFRELSNRDDTRAIEALMRRFARRLKHLELRREARRAKGRRLDLPGTIRWSVESGGTPFRIAWKDRRRIRPRLILLLDVSRSMSEYSFFYLRLARALCGELADVHCFIFHTRISGVSEALHDPDPWRSQEKLHLLAAGWAGGTRIGECLRDFIRDCGVRLVHSRTGVIIVSDGYDTGEPEVLVEALTAIRRRARRIVWLNPLLGRRGFAPVGRAMQAALPHLHLLAPGGDLASVESCLPGIVASLR